PKQQRLRILLPHRVVIPRHNKERRLGAYRVESFQQAAQKTPTYFVFSTEAGIGHVAGEENSVPGSRLGMKPLHVLDETGLLGRTLVFAGQLKISEMKPGKTSLARGLGHRSSLRRAASAMIATRSSIAGLDAPIRCCNIGAVDGCDRLSTAVSHHQLQ